MQNKHTARFCVTNQKCGLHPKLGGLSIKFRRALLYNITGLMRQTSCQPAVHAGIRVALGSAYSYYCIQRQMEMGETWQGQRQLTSPTQTPWRPGRNLPPPKVLMGRRARIVSGGSSALIPRPRSTGSLQMAINQCTNHTGLIAVSYRFRHSTCANITWVCCAVRPG
jgi:hypothetical protein